MDRKAIQVQLVHQDQLVLLAILDLVVAMDRLAEPVKQDQLVISAYLVLMGPMDK